LADRETLAESLVFSLQFVDFFGACPPQGVAGPVDKVLFFESKGIIPEDSQGENTAFGSATPAASLKYRHFYKTLLIKSQ
jgi:hypothetical protein